jgi:putative hydrolase of the HAD superfamily
MGLRKPEADAFVAVAKGIGAPLERILFFDDTQENVIGAQAAGMGAVLVRSPQDVIDAVTPYLAVSR